MTMFLSLPSDLILNIVARISLNHRPTLSLVSKSFQSLLASPDLYATRYHMGKTENIVYACLHLNKRNPKHRWLTLAPTPPQERLRPIPWFPYIYYHRSTVVSTGSEIYVIGGAHTRNRAIRSNRCVLLLDCRSHQWSRLEDMHVDRESPAVEVIDGKIYVIGGCTSKLDKDWGEVYDPKTQSWEPLLPTMLDLTTRKSVVPGRLVMGGKIYDIKGLKLKLVKDICLVEMDKNVFCLLSVSKGKLIWRDAKDGLGWSTVKGIVGLPYMQDYASYLVSMSGGRLTIWLKDCWRIWCAEISFERRSFQKLWGFVEWSKSVFDEGIGFGSDFFMHSTLVTH